MSTLTTLTAPQHYKGRAVIDPVAYYGSDGAAEKPDFILDDNDVEWVPDAYWVDDPIGSKKRGRFASYQNIRPENKGKHVLDDGHFFLFGRRFGGFTLKDRRYRKSPKQSLLG
jgi:hypothetical protein